MPSARTTLRWLVPVLGVLAMPAFVWLAIDLLVRHQLEAVRGTFAKEGFAASLAELIPSPAADEDNAAPLLDEIGQYLREADPKPLPAQAKSTAARTDGLFDAPPTRARPLTLKDRADRILERAVDFLPSPLRTESAPEDVLSELRELFASPELEKVLVLAHRASERPRFSPSLDYAAGPSLDTEYTAVLRNLVRLLNARVWLALRSGADADAIWRDLLAAERLGLLASEPPSLIYLLTSIACSGINQNTEREVLSAGILPSRDAEVLTFLLAYPHAPDGRFARALSFERLSMLDWIAPRLDESPAIDVLFRTPAAVRWLPHRAQRTWALAKIVDNHQVHLESLRMLRVTPVHRWVENLRRIESEEDGAAELAVPLFPGVLITCLADQARRRATSIAYAACVRRRETGAWPASLGELGLPETVTVDPSSGHTMHYAPNAHGLLVYAEGPDGKDDGGRDWQMAEARSVMDGDIAVELTLPR